MYLLDTNVLIYYLQNELSVVRTVEKILVQNLALVSSITEAELLSWPKLTETDQANILAAIATIPVIPVDSLVAQLAANLRRKYNIHLLDALIAATAIQANATLVTRNVKDFRKLDELKIQKI